MTNTTTCSPSCEVHFTSTHCPPSKGLEGSCELPFGFLFSPGCLGERDQKAAGEPVLCLHCLSYMNPYVDVLDLQQGIWNCNLCGNKNVTSPELLMNMTQTLQGNIQDYRRYVPRDHPPDSVNINSACNYIFVIDNNLSHTERLNIYEAFQKKSFIDEAMKGRIGLITYDQSVGVYECGIKGIASVKCYSGDLKSKSNTAIIKNDLFFCDYDDYDTYFLPCLSAGLGVDDVEDEVVQVEQKLISRKEMLRKRREARSNLKRGYTNSSLKRKHKKRNIERRCTGTAIKLALDLAEPGSQNRVIVLTNGIPNVGYGAILTKSVTEKVETPAMLESARIFRNLGDYGAMHNVCVDILCAGTKSVAVNIFQSLTAPSGGYVLLHPSFDDSSNNWIHNLGHLFRNTKTSKSIMKSPVTAFGTVIDFKMSDFVEPVQIVGPGEEFTRFDKMIDSSNLSSDSFLFPSERDIFAKGASLAASNGLPTNRIPSPELLSCSGYKCRVLVPRIDADSTFSFLLHTKENVSKHQIASFQMIIRWQDNQNSSSSGDFDCHITRVFTYVMPVANNVLEYVSGMQSDVSAVILGKEAVLRSATWFMGDRYEADNIDIDFGDEEAEEEALANGARIDLDSTIQKVSRSYRIISEKEGVKADSLKGLSFAFPSNLISSPFLRLLHNLRRGPMLGAGAMLQTAPDDRHALRDLFLRFPLAKCKKMMAPQLWRWCNSDTIDSHQQGEYCNEPYSFDVTVGESSSIIHLTAVLPETLVLWDDSVLVMDHYDNIFLWLGQGLHDEFVNAVTKEFLEKLFPEMSRDRFPFPSCYVLREGDSMGRRLTSRLVPSHTDPPEQQMVNFPGLTSLSAEELNGLRSKFRQYDNTGDDLSFRRWFWNVASASSMIEDGRSLCSCQQ